MSSQDAWSQPQALAERGCKRGACGGLCATKQSIPGLQSKGLFRRAPPLSACVPSSGPGCPVDTAGGQPTFRSGSGASHPPWNGVRKQGEPHRGLHSMAADCPPQQSGWHSCGSHSSVTKPCGAWRRHRKDVWSRRLSPWVGQYKRVPAASHVLRTQKSSSHPQPCDWASWCLPAPSPKH